MPRAQITALHGSFGSPEDFRSLKAALKKEDYTLNAPHLWKELQRSRLSMGAWVNSFLEQHPSEENIPSVLMGYSMGGRLALHVALHEKNFFDAYIFVSSRLELKTEELLQRQLWTQMWLERLEQLEWGAFVDLWEQQEIFRQSEKNLSLPFLEDYRKELSWAFKEASSEKQVGFWSRLSEIKKPVLLVSGAQDKKYTEEYSLAAQDFGFEHRVLKGVGHRFLASHAQELAEISHEFLRKI